MLERLAHWTQKLLQSPGRHSLGVCGFGGTGKSTACRATESRVGSACVTFETDWYVHHTSKFRRESISEAIAKDDQKELQFWSSPINWYNWQAIADDLEILCRTGELQREGLWRTSTGEKDLSVCLTLPGTGVVLVDGIYLLHPPFRELLSAVIFLQADIKAALARSAARDIHRNPTPHQEFKKRITYSHDLPYFEKWKAFADEIVVISG